MKYIRVKLLVMPSIRYRTNYQNYQNGVIIGRYDNSARVSSTQKKPTKIRSRTGISLGSDPQSSLRSISEHRDKMSGKMDSAEVPSNKTAVSIVQQEAALLGIRKLLRFYSSLGIIPVKISRNCDSFETQTWRYLLGPAMAFVMVISISIFGAAKYGSKGYYAVASEESIFSSLGKTTLQTLGSYSYDFILFFLLDHAIYTAQGYVLLICICHIMYVTKKSTLHWNSVLEHTSNHSVPPTNSVIWKHVVLMVLAITNCLLVQASIFGFSKQDFQR